MLATEKGRVIASAMTRDPVMTEFDGPFAQVEGGSAMPGDASWTVEGLAELWSARTGDVDFQLKENLRSLSTANST
jgi:Tat protein secretion system quality control protein TatD with DNase activity